MEYSAIDLHLRYSWIRIVTDSGETVLERRVTTTRGNYTLAPAEGAARADEQAIQIPRPDGSSLWLEFRRPFGTFDRARPGDGPIRGITIRLQPKPSFAYTQSYLLDASPTRPGSDTLWSGEVFKDPLSHIKIKIISTSKNGAVITIGGRGAT